MSIEKLIQLHDEIAPFYFKNNPFFRFKDNVMFEDEHGRQCEVPNPTQEEVDQLYDEYLQYLELQEQELISQIEEQDKLLKTKGLSEDEVEYLTQTKQELNKQKLQVSIERKSTPKKPKVE